MIDLSAFLFISLALFICFAIVSFCKAYYKINYMIRPGIFLFKHNNLKLSCFSIVGTTFSLSLLFGGMIWSGFKHGAWIFFPLIASYTSVWILFAWLAQKSPNFMTFNGSNDRVICSFVGRYLGHGSRLCMIFVVLTFTISIISSELFVLRYYISNLLFSNEFISPFLITLIALIICVSYVLRGGFIGVLWTDFFQVILIAIWLVVSVIQFNGASVGQVTKYLENKKKISSKSTIEYVSKLEKTVNLHMAEAKASKEAKKKNKFETGAGLYFFFATILIVTMGLWVKIFGTLESKREKLLSIHISFPIIIGISCLFIYVGTCFHPKFSEISLKPFGFLIQLAGYYTQNSSCYFILTSTVFVMVALTTIDSMLIYIWQGLFKFDHNFNGIISKNISIKHLVTAIAATTFFLSINLGSLSNYLSLTLSFNISLLGTFLIFRALSENQIKSEYLSKAVSLIIPWDDKKSIILIWIFLITMPILFVFNINFRSFLLENYYISPVMHFIIFAVLNRIIIWKNT